MGIFDGQMSFKSLFEQKSSRERGTEMEVREREQQ
jgi:hypothetical protein